LIFGKEKDFNAYNTSKRGLKGWTLGSKTGDRFLRFYNKSKEIENNPKPWISNYWKFQIILLNYLLTCLFCRRFENSITLLI
jgi:DNA relaxase NicK